MCLPLRPALAAAALLALFAPPARATCGSASCFLMTDTARGTASKGALRVDLGFEYVDQSGQRSGSHGTDSVITPAIDFADGVIVPNEHLEIRTDNTLVHLNLVYGISDRVSLTAFLPLVQDRYHEHVDGVGSPDEAFSNQAGTRGFGDVRLGVRGTLLVRGANLLLGDLTVKAPTGSWKLRDGNGEITEPSLQPGTGSWDGIAALQWARHDDASRVEWFAGASYRLNGRNGLQYRMGDELAAHAGAEVLAGGRVRLSIQLNGRVAGRDDYGGQGIPSTGGTHLNLTPGVLFGTTTSFYLHVQLPVYQNVNEAQLTPRVGFLVGVAHNF